MHQLGAAAARLRDAQRVVAFTGAGISVDSGIPTFRDDDGLWREFPPDTFATWNGLVRGLLLRPRSVARFAHAVVNAVAQARPNAGHRALHELERHKPLEIVTQNIDGLHQAAGSNTVWEVHGSLFKITSLRGRFRRLLSRADLQRIAARLERAARSPFVATSLPLAIRPLLGVGWRGLHRPSVVLFGDRLAEPDWTRARAAARASDCLLSIGTSGAVLPAAELPHIAATHGATVIQVDPEPAFGDVCLRGAASEILPELVRVAFG